MNAFVEIVFDNSDHRFALENSDEVVLRRTVGLKKDEFFLQRKRANKNEVLSLLEGAGFSKSNPYFIVQQGKVQDCCTMSDVERLRLLKEVAGTTVYDEKKNESLAKMEENAGSCAKIQDILSDIEDRLTELQSEKEELTQYQQLDRQRRALEYTVYDKELRKARAALDSVEHEREEQAEQTSSWHAKASNNHESIQNVEAVLKAKQAALRRSILQCESLEGDKTEAVTRHTQAQLAWNEMTEALEVQAEQERSNQKELALLDKEIEKVETELREEAQPAYDKATSELQRSKEERDAAANKMAGLYAKQGRGRQFATVEQRDEHLQGQIEEAETGMREKQGQLREQQDQLAHLRRTVAQEKKDAATAASAVKEKAAALQNMSKAMEDKRRARLAEHDARQNVWRQAESQQEEVREARETLQACLDGFYKSMPRATAQGLQALKGIVQQERLVEGKQYFGTVLDNFTLRDAKYATAVEVAAQNQLFHVIVDNDRTAARLMTKLEQGKLGRVTFLPLSQLRPDTHHNNRQQSADVVPLMETCLTYDPAMERAMQQVFGRRMLARTTELAAEWSAKLSMDVITLEGDLCSRKGALTGGFVDKNKSRWNAHASLQRAQVTLREAETSNQTIKQKAHATDQAVTSLMQDIQRLEAKHAQLSQQVGQAETQVERLKSRAAQHEQQAAALETKAVPALERDIAVVQADVERLREELGTPLQESLSEQDRELLEQLKKVQAELVEDIQGQNDRVQETTIVRQALVSKLDDNLRKRRKELTSGADTASAGLGSSTASVRAARQQEAEERRQEMEAAATVKDELEGRLEDAREQQHDLKRDMVAAKTELEKYRSEDAKISRAIEEAQDQSDRLLNKVSNKIYMNIYRLTTTSSTTIPML